ncbi:RNA polymerase sigma factor [Kribbella sp. NBC_01245]|uniref:RNA polymerase sigma factor n=1 Tax=Kribbella sp. NBC_01245 TaxID=2903578 RepID=UPI002E2AF744|nr:RNA polymerase sigma factor [Kribbella sp. NBC_01245]
MLARVRAGDTGAYAELVRWHAPIAQRTAVLLGAGADADDVVQEAFVKAYRGLGGFRDGAAFRPWLLRIVANETKNLHRSRVRRTRREAAWPEVDAVELDPSVQALSAERRAELLAAIRRLSDDHRKVVTCRYLLDLDEQETAEVLGWPRGTVKSRLSRALAKLRVQLGDHPVAGKLDAGKSDAGRSGAGKADGGNDAGKEVGDGRRNAG